MKSSETNSRTALATAVRSPRARGTLVEFLRRFWPQPAPEYPLCINPDNPPATCLFGGIDHLLEWAKLMFVVVGAPRSGKSLLLKMLALSALETIRAGHTERAFFFDYKREYEPWLRGLVPPDQLKVIEPFDRNAVAWDIAADIHNVDQAQAVGKLLTPTRPDAREPFFDDVVGALVAGVLVSLHITREGRWSLMDLVERLQSPESIHQALLLAPELNRFRIETYLKAKVQNRDVLATLGNRIQDLEAVARRWEMAGEAVSLSDWMKGKFTLVLGHSHEQAQATEAIVRALFHRLCQILLDCPDNDYPQSWIFLDELPSAGRLDGLHDLLSKGPSRGVVAAIGFQDIGSLRHIYGPDRTQALNSFLAHKAFLRIADPDTAEWASRHFGEMEVTRTQASQSWTEGSNLSSTFGLSEHFGRERVVPPEKFLNMPALSPPDVNSLGAFIVSPHLGRYPYELTFDTIQRFFPRGLAGEAELGQPAPLRRLPGSPAEPDDLPYI